MEPNMTRNSFLHRTPPPHIQSTSKIRSPIGFNAGTSNSKSPTQTAVKQTWEEFCLEQEQQRCLSRNYVSSIRPPQFVLNNRAAPPYRPTSAPTSDNYPSFTQPNGIRLQNHNQANNIRWQQRSNFKRAPSHCPNDEPSLKTPKKKKKLLSQNTLFKKREWSMEDAERALAIEKECNRRNKCCLIIKFPDLDLNRDIVAGFHPDIENVHFQQPSTPRFCFVTLKDTANADEVIEALNKHKFGDNYLVVEHKRDREEDRAVNANNIDPFTLYVGNLAQEITKEDMVQLYPNNRRIDIGYAKKMKYTRYAFVVFHTTDAAVEAFKRTHNHEIHNKSLIVRFRRLHGTLEMSKALETSKLKEIPSEQSSAEDWLEVGFENSVRPFTINIKQESHADYDFDETTGMFNECEELPEANLQHHPKSIKLEVKSEVKPEVCEYTPEMNMGVKSEFKQEEPEFNEFYDLDFDVESDCYVQEDDFEKMYRDLYNQRKQVASLRFATL